MIEHGSFAKKKIKFNSGVDFVKRRGKYRARVVWERKRYELGYFDTEKMAADEVARAKLWISGFPNRDFAKEFE